MYKGNCKECAFFYDGEGSKGCLLILRKYEDILANPEVNVVDFKELETAPQPACDLFEKLT